MGNWYGNLTTGPARCQPEIKQKVAELTAGTADPLDKMRALARFVQHDIRYVAIELGIGGFQPHPAADVFGTDTETARIKQRLWPRCCTRSASIPTMW